MKKKIFFYILSISIPFVFGIIGYINFSQNYDSIQTGNSYIDRINRQEVSVHASWGDEESSVENLIKSADLIVTGTLGAPIETIEPRKNVVYTKHSFYVKDVIKGENIEKKIPVITHGGISREGKKVNWDLLELEESGSYLLFLNKLDSPSIPTGMKSAYISVNGPSGLYKVNIDENLGNFNALQSDYDGTVNFSSGENLSITNMVSQLNLEKLKTIVKDVSNSKNN